MRRILLPIALAFALGMTACSTSAGELPPSRTATATPASSASASTPPAPDCGDPRQSFNLQSAPLAMPSGSTMAAIKRRGRLIAGVSADTWKLGAWNPLDRQIEGFDIDMLHAVAKAILGDPNKIEFKSATTRTRIPMVKEEVVDVALATITMTPERAKEVDFSDVYFVTGPAVGVRKDSP